MLFEMIEQIFVLCHEYESLSEQAREIIMNIDDGGDLDEILAERTRVHREYMELRSRAYSLSARRKMGAHLTISGASPIYIIN